MPSEEATSTLSPTIHKLIDRPKSSISAISEAATFYSAQDFIHDQKKTNLARQDVEALDRTLPPTKCVPNLTRDDSGYAVSTDVSSSSSFSSSKYIPSSLTYLNRNKHRKRSLSNSSKKTRKPLHGGSFGFNYPYTHVYTCQYQQETISRRSSCYKKPDNSYQQTLFSEYHSLTKSEFDLSSSFSEHSPSPSSPLPSTIHYWTSDNTRRLEYEAIDAASKGVRGFFTRLVPDCILPAQVRNNRFWEHEDEKKGKEGSVRRYRLALPEELTDVKIKKNGPIRLRFRLKDGDKKKCELLRTWSTGFKFGQIDNRKRGNRQGSNKSI